MTKSSQIDKNVSNMKLLDDIRIEFKADEEQNYLVIECHRNGKLVYWEKMDASIFAKMSMHENPVHEIVGFLNPYLLDAEKRSDSNRNVKKRFNSFGIWVLKLLGKYKKLTI